MEQALQSNRLLSRDLQQIRIAVAGLGKMGGYHLKALQQLASGESEDYYKSGLGAQISKLTLCALCDPYPERAGELGIDAPIFTDWQELLETMKPDLVVISSPTATHFELAFQALESGVHTFVEKPLVTNLNEFEKLAEVAAANGCRLMSGHVERYNPVAIKMRAMLALDQMDVESYRFRRTQPHDLRISDDIVTDKIIHDLDLAQYFFGPIVDCTLLDSKQVDGLTQEASVELSHANGMKGTLFVSWLLGDEQCREVRIACKDGTMVVGDFSSKALHFNEHPLSCNVPSWVKPDNNQIKDELADFVAFCLVPDPSLPKFSPLLRLDEIETSIGIVEELIQKTKEVAHA